MRLATNYPSDDIIYQENIQTWAPIAYYIALSRHISHDKYLGFLLNLDEKVFSKYKSCKQRNKVLSRICEQPQTGSSEKPHYLPNFNDAGAQGTQGWILAGWNGKASQPAGRSFLPPPLFPRRGLARTLFKDTNKRVFLWQ